MGEGEFDGGVVSGRGMGGLLGLLGRVNLFPRFLFALDYLEIGSRVCGRGGR